MENIEVDYENLQIGALYVYSHRDTRNKEVIMLYKNPLNDVNKLDEEVISYIPQKTPFMVLKKSRIGYNNSYYVMWTDENTETAMGWIRNVDVVFEDYRFFIGCEENTVDCTKEEITNCKAQFERKLLFWQATAIES